MSDSNFNEYDYNNGIPPRDGMVWNPGDQEYAGHWGWKTDGANIPPGQGNTLPSLIVWPEKPDVTDWYIPGEKPFNPTTGDGWVPAIDGYGELLPAGVPAVIQTAINQVKTAPLKGSITASDIWKLTPPPGYPGGNYVVDPVFIYFPVQALTDSNISAMASAPEKMPLQTRILDDVHDGVQFISAVSAGGSPYNLPVIKATARGSYYTIGRLPGMMSSNTFEFYAKPPRADSWFVSNETKAGGGVREAGFTAGASTSDCVIWFPDDSGLEPLYFSMVIKEPAVPLQRRQDAENKARAEAYAARAQAEAAAKAKADAEARAKAEEARKAEEVRRAEEARKAEEARRAEEARKAEEARRAEEARKAEETRKALFAKAGVLDAPTYTPEMVKSANAALAAAGATILNRTPGMIQWSSVAKGVATATSEFSGWVSSALWRGAYEVGSIRASTVVATGSVLGAFTLAFYSKEAGTGSDQVPGRDVNLFAFQASLAAAGQTTIQPGMTSVDLPVRGFISTDSDGKQSVNFVKTGVGGVSPSVPVFRPVRDEKTGLDKITLPAMEGVPARTILINPVPTGPAAPAHTGNDSPVPTTPVHTGTEVKQADSIVVTTFPADVVHDMQDFILWQPDATGTGVEPIYVMVSNPRDLPGKVSGRGEKVGEGWLNNAGRELGAPIPNQIADKLRGREFTSFGAFRRAFWSEVSKDPELSKQFKGNNQGNLKNGYSPFTPKSERIGERIRYELHHVKPISDGGAVYDIDGIRVTTPKRHIEIHKGEK